MSRLIKDSSNWLLCEFLDNTGTKITNASDGGTSAVTTLTRPRGGGVAFAAQAMTYDSAKTMTRSDGTRITGCWKFLCTASHVTMTGDYAAEAVATGTTSGTRRHKYWTVRAVDREDA